MDAVGKLRDAGSMLWASLELGQRVAVVYAAAGLLLACYLLGHGAKRRQEQQLDELAVKVAGRLRG